MRRTDLFAVLALAAFRLTDAASAQTPLWASLRINEGTAGHQTAPDVALRPDGSGLVVWASAGGTNPSNIVCRQVNLLGDLSLEQNCNQFSAGDQTAPQIEMSSNGDRAIAWISVDQFGPSSDADTIVRWTHELSIQPEQLGQANSNSDPVAVDVAQHADGSFITVWREGSALWAHRFSGAGESLGDDEVVASDANLGDFDVAALPNGKSVVVFRAPTGDHAVYGRLVDADGSGFGFPFPLPSTDSIYSQNMPQVDSDASGNFVAAWYDPAGKVYVRRFRADATPLSGEIQVNPASIALSQIVRLGVDRDGGFVVAWTNQVEDDAPYDLWAREYSRTGAPIGGAFAVESTQDAKLGGIAMSPGRFLAVWQVLEDGDVDVWGRLYARGGLFSDGFESGNTAAWAAF